MEITLLRHGKPDSPSLDKLNAQDFRTWVKAYDASTLSTQSNPPDQVLACAINCRAIVCSSLPRSIHSAKALSSEKVVLCDPIFNEAGLPSANWRWLKLSPKLWAVFFRMLWLLGYARYSESLQEAKVRAGEAVKILSALACKHDSVMFVGHGVYNRILAKELRRTGWVGPKNLGSQYWSYGVYKKSLTGSSDHT